MLPGRRAGPPLTRRLGFRRQGRRGVAVRSCSSRLAQGSEVLPSRSRRPSAATLGISAPNRRRLAGQPSASPPWGAPPPQLRSRPRAIDRLDRHNRSDCVEIDAEPDATLKRDGLELLAMLELQIHIHCSSDPWPEPKSTRRSLRFHSTEAPAYAPSRARPPPSGRSPSVSARDDYSLSPSLRSHWSSWLRSVERTAAARRRLYAGRSSSHL
jgi:hypothetical protein